MRIKSSKSEIMRNLFAFTKPYVRIAGMRIQRTICSGSTAAITALCLFAFSWPVAGQDKEAKGGAFSIGARYHTDHSAYRDLPFGNGDISYMLALEYAERLALWQLGVDFAPDVSGTRDLDPEEDQVGTRFVITPQLNLIFKDRVFRAGTGVLTSYVKDDDGEGEWLGPYWQLLLGLSFNIAGSVSLDTSAHYVMKSWDKITDFKFGDLEYSMLLTFRF